jgi:biotin transport system substrate-specific component
MPVAWYADDKTGTSIAKGWHVATGSTAGYFVGFIVAAAAVGYLAEQKQDRSLATSIPASLAGTAIIYVCGVAWLAHSLNIPVATGDANAIGYGLTPFLIGDTVKLLLVGGLAPLAWKFASRD